MQRHRTVMKTSRGATIIAALYLSIFSSASGTEIAYSLTQIEGFGSDINDKGQVIGYMQIRQGFA